MGFVVLILLVGLAAIAFGAEAAFWVAFGLIVGPLAVVLLIAFLLTLLDR